jgi:Fe-S-cluster-containing dehydrogenase component/DMSO reductase anchor subunit
MRKGFIYNKDKCVNCKACTAACILENGWNLSGRQVLSFNSETVSLIPLINLSLACNHCESAVCMTGCPSSAYNRDVITGAVVLDESKCVGCRYCQWNCPYDAPKFDPSLRIIVKCNLCYQEIKSGYEPSCTTACPTGALSFGELSESTGGNTFYWFPDKNLEPAIEFISADNSSPLIIVPEQIQIEFLIPEKERKNILAETSLIIFSFLSTLLVSAMAASFFKGILPDIFIFSGVLLLTGLISLFHLGRKLRSWRAVINVRRSPLSREIAAFIVFSLISIVALFFQQPYLIIAASIAGLSFLVLIDNVYIFSERNRNPIFHSGQTFLSALVIISFFSGAVLPFIFMAAVKMILIFPALKSRNDRLVLNLRFFRIVFLILPGLSLILHPSIPDYFVIIIFLTGELFDRILFYIDFNPVNIKNLMPEQLNIENNEKKRG